jgi:hypothetical protein
MENRYYLVSDGKVYAIWGMTPEHLVKQLEHKPQFKLVGPPWGGFATREEAEAARQARQNAK